MSPVLAVGFNPLRLAFQTIIDVCGWKPNIGAGRRENRPALRQNQVVTRQNDAMAECHPCNMLHDLLVCRSFHRRCQFWRGTRSNSAEGRRATFRPDFGIGGLYER
jgi:hypothetical protein